MFLLLLLTRDSLTPHWFPLSRLYLLPQPVFRRIDKDGSGAIDRQELVMALQGDAVARSLLKVESGEGALERLFNSIDADGDGEVTWAEFEAYFSGRTKDREKQHAEQVARIEASASTLAQTVDVFESEIEEDRRYADQGDHMAAARVAVKMAEKHARDAAEAVVREAAEAKEAAFVSRLSAAQQAAGEGDMAATIEVAKLLAVRAEEQEAARAAAAAAYARILADDEMSANYAVWTGGRDVAERAYKDKPNDPEPQELEAAAAKGGQGALGKGGAKGLLLVGSILKFENDLDAEDIRILQVLTYL